MTRKRIRNYWYDARCWNNGYYIIYRLYAGSIRKAKNRLKKLYGRASLVKISGARR